jgi:hypothetical protein
MTGKKHDAQNKGAKLRDQAHPRPHFWHNAHRDWRVWFAAVLMIALMVVYVMTQDLSWRPGEAASPSIPAANVP